MSPGLIPCFFPRLTWNLTVSSRFLAPLDIFFLSGIISFKSLSSEVSNLTSFFIIAAIRVSASYPCSRSLPASVLFSPISPFSIISTTPLMNLSCLTSLTLSTVGIVLLRIGFLVYFSIFSIFLISFAEASVKDEPSLPALPVLPIRCT
ncbi:hypothetical protein SDC9_86424 [bioreactor metagenome]|uniref:Uncharacterized protein n=1 Tax=bioreactor metagenome TaxID=1076179 RepID=A0A644ZG72_9ZZZZ